MTNRDKLKEVFGTKVNFEFVLDPEWLSRTYKKPVRYTPRNNDVVEFFDGSLGFVYDNVIINKCQFLEDGWGIWHIDKQLDMGSIKYIYRGACNPLYYLTDGTRKALQILDIVYSDPNTLLKN